MKKRTRQTIGVIALCAGCCVMQFCRSQPSASESSKLNYTDDLEPIKYNHPEAIVDLAVGLWAVPMPMDFDGDGDLDLLVSCPDVPYNGTYFFENVKEDSVTLFKPGVRLCEAIQDIQISYPNGQPRLLVPGKELIDFKKTLGKKNRELWRADIVGSDFKKKPRFNQWSLVDFDADGDEDILIGIDDWSDYGWDNAFDSHGIWKNGPLHGYVYFIENKDGQYLNRGKILSQGKVLDVFGTPSPSFSDFDNDGDLDLICGEFLDKLTYFHNVGSATKPIYGRGNFLTCDTGVIRLDLEMIMPVAIDWNKDGFTDLVVGIEDGRVALVEHTGKFQQGQPIFKSPKYFRQYADNLKFGSLATPFSVDWDNDGDEDIISGNSAGYIAFIENLGMNHSTPKWALPALLRADGKIIRIQAGPNGSIQGPAEAKWGYTTLTVADWDNDGLKDIIVNSIWGHVIWYKNIGTPSNPQLSSAKPVIVDWKGSPTPKPEWTWWSPQDGNLVTQWRTTPFVVDWNGDKLMDLVMIDRNGYLSLFRRSGDSAMLLNPPERVFYGVNFSAFNHEQAVRDSLPGPIKFTIGRAGSAGRRKFSIVDWDADGDLDFLANSTNVTLMENVGTRDDTVFLENKSPLSTRILAGHDTSPTTVDWDKDGTPDLLIGGEDGHFYYQHRSGATPKSKK